jgi:Xaa-Pro aminopeptidase
MDIANTGTIVIQPTAPEHVRNGDAHFRYRPDSDFYYLTGFAEPQAVVVLVPGRAQGEYLLFCRERDEQAEVWHGKRAGVEGACEVFQADDAFPIGDIDEILPGLIENKERIFYTMGRYPDFDQRVLAWIAQVGGRKRAGINTPDEIISLSHHLHEMRLFKSREELKAMRQAAAVSVSGHQRAMRACRPGRREFEMEAEITHAFVQGGGCVPAYTPIIGGGANSCVLHYTENNAVLRDGDVLLIDAGAEYDCYASDITRTFPVNGRFSDAQREVYEIVLAAQAAAIAEAKPGNHWNDPHEAAIKTITRGLQELGILKGRLPSLIKQEAYKPFYMHRTGHWLGMDVHDVGDYKVEGEWRVLEPGMVMTVEPGLYFTPGRKRATKRWWGIGVRIEDDVLVTEKGNEVLTAALPKTMAEIESLMAG